MTWTLLVAGCGLIRLAVKDALVLAAFRMSAQERRLLPGIAGTEVLIASVAELSLGTLAAFAASRSALALVYATPLVISLQRSIWHPQLVSEARTDAKTGLLNDRTWHREAAGEVARSARTGTPLALGIMDLDHFKAVNDQYGHLAGDAVLSAVASTLTGLLRPYDLAGRVGGEEFAFLLPNSRAPEAVEVAERLREQIPLALSQQAPAGPMPLRVTVSIGLAAADRDDWDLDTYYRLADQALYAAKESGRDTVWIVCADQQGELNPRPGDATRASPAQDAPSSPAAPEGETQR
jgi:diguanylate cyclase (GGDEF)-like protein